MTHTKPHDTKVEPTIPLFCLKTGTAPKLGQHAQGAIHYELLTDADRQTLLLRLTGNDGGGNHSPEPVPFSRVQAIVAGLPPDSPVPSRVFRSCFRGRSQNNAGFCCLALRAEGLLLPIEGKRYQHKVAGDWANWATQTLALPGEPTELAVSLVGDALPVDTPAPVPMRRGKRKTQPEDAEDACLA